MYRIIGADGREYGPVSLDQLRAWLADGRVNPQTKVQVEGRDDWALLKALPEFAVAASSVPPLAPPIAARVAPATATAASGQTSGLAIASLVLGITGFLTCGLSSIVGLILGFVARRKIKRSDGHLTGKGLALAGICLSAASWLLIMAITVAVVIPAVTKAREGGNLAVCKNNLESLGVAFAVYVHEHDGAMPSAAKWCDELAPHVGQDNAAAFQCPSAPSQKCAYAYNAALDGLKLTDIPQPKKTVLLFEIEGGWNASGVGDRMISWPRHGGKICVLMVDGHVETCDTTRLKSLRWNP